MAVRHFGIALCRGGVTVYANDDNGKTDSWMTLRDIFGDMRYEVP